MKKVELLDLSRIVNSLKLPRLTADRRLAWLQLSAAMTAKAKTIWDEKEAITAIVDIDDAEREKMWILVLGQQIDFTAEPIAQDELMAILDVNEDLTIAAQQMLVTNLIQTTKL